MKKLLLFLFTTITDKEGATRATSTMIVTLTIVYQFFVPRLEYDNIKADYDALKSQTIQRFEYDTLKSQTDKQQRLLWAQIAQMKNTLQKNHIYVPSIVDTSNSSLYDPSPYVMMGSINPTQ